MVWLGRSSSLQTLLWVCALRLGPPPRTSSSEQTIRERSLDRHVPCHCLRVHFEVEIYLASLFSLHSSFSTQHSIQRHTSPGSRSSPCSIPLAGSPSPTVCQCLPGRPRVCRAGSGHTYTQRAEPLLPPRAMTRATSYSTSCTNFEIPPHTLACPAATPPARAS